MYFAGMVTGGLFCFLFVDGFDTVMPMNLPSSLNEGALMGELTIW